MRLEGSGGGYRMRDRGLLFAWVEQQRCPSFVWVERGYYPLFVWVEGKRHPSRAVWSCGP
jgi:hypothetical protein